MIKNCFSFLPKMSYKKEENIFKQGIKNWDSFIKKDKIIGISPSKKKGYDEILKLLNRALYEEDIFFINSFIPLKYHWMLYDDFIDSCIYLDIEVTGINKKDDIFLFGFYDGKDTKIMVRDFNLDLNSLSRILSEYKMIITFNGSVHDINFLDKRYPFLFKSFIHIDLRFLSNKIGLTGGLKEIEKNLNIFRPKISKVDTTIVRLWRLFKETKNEFFLERLISYSQEDIINLDIIARKIISFLKIQRKEYINSF
jgi:uncharacterized protein